MTALTVRNFLVLVFLLTKVIVSLEMSHLSSSLRTESEKYRKAARDINLYAMLRQWAPVGAFVLIFLIFIWWRFF